MNYSILFSSGSLGSKRGMKPITWEPFVQNFCSVFSITEFDTNLLRPQNVTVSPNEMSES